MTELPFHTWCESYIFRYCHKSSSHSGLENGQKSDNNNWAANEWKLFLRCLFRSLARSQLSWIIFCILHWHCEHEQQHSTFSLECALKVVHLKAHDGEGLNREKMRYFKCRNCVLCRERVKKGKNCGKSSKKAKWNSFSTISIRPNKHHQHIISWRAWEFHI